MDVAAIVRPDGLVRTETSVRDPETFEALYAAHARYVAGVVHRIMGRADGELDDIV